MRTIRVLGDFWQICDAGRLRWRVRRSIVENFEDELNGSWLGQRNTIAESRIPLPLDVIVASLMPLERRFIDKLNDELDKVEAFYVAREKDAKAKLVSTL